LAKKDKTRRKIILKSYGNFINFLAHLAKGHESLCHGVASVRRKLFHLNDFFSRTTWPISRKLALGMGIQIVHIKGLAPFGAK